MIIADYARAYTDLNEIDTGLDAIADVMVEGDFQSILPYHYYYRVLY